METAWRTAINVVDSIHQEMVGRQFQFERHKCVECTFSLIHPLQLRLPGYVVVGRRVDFIEEAYISRGVVSIINLITEL